MNGFATLTSSTACWHDGAQISEGPTTHQRNWWCPACGATRTTFPGDSAEAHFAARAARSQAPAVAHQPETSVNNHNTFNTAFLKLQEIIGQAGSIQGYWPGDSGRVERVVKLANEVIDLLMQRPASGDITHAEYIALANPGALKPLEVGFGPQETQPPVQGTGDANG